MKAIIFNGAKEGDLTIMAIETAITNQLIQHGWNVEPLELRNLKIAECVGCFGCWVKSPGTCVINDDGRETTRKFIQSDLAIWLTPITFGGFSYELKKAFDRIIPLVLPYFEFYKGKTRHKARYEKYPKLLIIGVQNPGLEGEETFLELAERNRVFSPAFAAAVFQRDKKIDTFPAFIEEQLRKVEVIS